MERNQENQNEEVNVQAPLYNPVYQSLINWNADRNDLSVVSGWLNQGSMFKFTITMDSSPYVHAYPGVVDGDLVFQVITSDHDVITNFSTSSPPPYVVTAPLDTKPMPHLGGEIDPAIAVERVDNWANTLKRSEWLLQQTTNETMFQAMIIPADDIETGMQYGAFFALKDGEEDDYIFDLILVNLDTNEVLDGKKTVYYDMTRPVPPYKPGFGREKANFGLLNFVETLP